MTTTPQSKLVSPISIQPSRISTSGSAGVLQHGQETAEDGPRAVRPLRTSRERLLSRLQREADTQRSRRVGGTTRFGTLLDPIADKTVILAVAITLLLDGTIVWWELLLIASRDLFVIAISIGVLFQNLKQPMETSPLLIGKLATAAQFIYLATLFLFPEARWFVFLIAAPISLLAGFAYLYDAINQVRELSVHKVHGANLSAD